jgi:SAM-dependent methyltransferase
LAARAYDPVMRVAGWQRTQRSFAGGLRSVLDVGSGTAAAAAAIGPGYVGVDAEVAMLQRARPGTRVLAADACALPFRDDSFDIVLCTGFLGVLSPPVRAGALAEIARVARHALWALEPVAGVTRAKWLALSRHPIDLDEFRAAGFEPSVGEPVYFGLYAPVVATLETGCTTSHR